MNVRFLGLYLGLTKNSMRLVRSSKIPKKQDFSGEAGMYRDAASFEDAYKKSMDQFKKMDPKTQNYYSALAFSSNPRQRQKFLRLADNANALPEKPQKEITAVGNTPVSNINPVQSLPIPESAQLFKPVTPSATTPT